MKKNLLVLDVFLLLGNFLLEQCYFGEHDVCRMSFPDIFLYKILCVKEISDIETIHKGCPRVRRERGK